MDGQMFLGWLKINISVCIAARGAFQECREGTMQVFEGDD
ncbi:MAG: hypothetical protein C5S49_07960 [Candidatus Methanogaster sp.]|nr:MAG: hypothetical protein C5S49_07960 [ANME-2 cluster archaeon]